jgi:hypothetical protein
MFGMQYKTVALGLLVGAVILSVILAGASWTGALKDNARLKLQLAQAEEGLKRAQAARKRDQAVLVALQKENAATARKTASARGSLRAAAAASAPAWANTPVPKEIQDALP